MANKLTINLENSQYMIFHRSGLKDCDNSGPLLFRIGKRLTLHPQNFYE